MTLYDLQGDYLNLLQMAEAGDIDEQTFIDTLEGIEGEIKAKADAYAIIIKSLESDAALLKAEENRLAERRKTLSNEVGRMKRSLESAMRTTGKLKFKTEHFSFGIQKNPPALKYSKDIDLMELPAEYVKFGKPELDTEAVTKAIKAGAKFDWAYMEQGESVRFR